MNDPYTTRLLKLAQSQNRLAPDALEDFKLEAETASSSVSIELAMVYDPLTPAHKHDEQLLNIIAEWKATYTPIGASMKRNGGSEKRWTADFTAKVRIYRERHTEAETAAEFGISGTRIREKLSPKPQAKAHNMYSQLAN